MNEFIYEDHMWRTQMLEGYKSREKNVNLKQSLNREQRKTCPCTRTEQNNQLICPAPSGYAHHGRPVEEGSQRAEQAFCQRPDTCAHGIHGG